ncbi:MULTISPECIES: FAD-dependent oxidoreductase [Bradyrhizobium]|jgi:3-(3-hydroxy-phenyl)propionate hydroxylase|uniref:FAD-dependent oxidoreductase n=4 Tax=Pseudomonadota TaxID=1224 RepID=A0ABS5GEP9_9BRAD|nr:MULTISPECIES: FAD-dependent oxidoreductase [Bradyrhizobium]MBR1139822.1 FAD-dependent oxidoreductase [Bradyrhizobium denitrificans]MDU1493851.1 FAD-dependent oxidoreductase [Bradyrhizobium sp.]MDU1545558.1 FAD-dependent oxidoreductase [Bradyrhizobium sp.]MDU1803400.1 FAD-dependent oxidoreductase [Bradyrhizobium sp.]MDU3043423.1 FAD-dependent oxidoreductase [Bradyrhizobium sp.]
MSNYVYPRFPYACSAEQRSGTTRRHPVVVIGAGPIGLTAALDLAARGQPVVVLDDNDTVSIGSRAVCYAKRPLEIWDRLGCAAAMVEKGVSWNIGKVFFRDQLSYQFDLLPEPGHRWPAMINLQQYHLEEILVGACTKSPLVDLRWKHRLVSLKQFDDHADLAVETPDGIFTMEAQWVIACDGANSDTRRMVGAEFKGQFFQDRFLIADVRMKADFPTERWFWFDPPFHPGQSVLLHRQSDNIWRIDFQLGWDADPDEEKKPERVIPRIRAMLGESTDFELEWVSIYQFACRRIDQFRRGRVLFAGDAAHQVSPFGARGANTGVQDIDNLAWKLALVLRGEAPESLVDSYHEERAYAADDNILNSTRATDFITPKTRLSRHFRDAVLDLAQHHAFARPLVNSGRLSTPTPYVASALNTPDRTSLAGPMTPGTNAADVPVILAGQPGWLLNCLGSGFTVLTFDSSVSADEVRVDGIAARVIVVGRDIADAKGLLAERYGASSPPTYVFRPDQYVTARFPQFDETAIAESIRRACGKDGAVQQELAA